LITTQDGTQQVPKWLYTGTQNDIVAFPPLTTLFLGTQTPPLGLLNVNQGPNVCTPGAAPGGTTFWGSIVNSQFVPTVTNAAIATIIPCPTTGVATGLAPSPFIGAINGATAYLGNGPGDGTFGMGVAPGPGPNLNFIYDAGTVLTITPQAPDTQHLTACAQPNAPWPAQPVNVCILGPEGNPGPRHLAS